MVKLSAVGTSHGHNGFDLVEVCEKISLSLLSLIHKEDKNIFKFGIVVKELICRPVVLIGETNSYIDLLTARVINNRNIATIVRADNISYYDGCFVFKANSGENAFIDKEILIKNYGYSIID